MKKGLFIALALCVGAILLFCAKEQSSHSIKISDLTFTPDFDCFTPEGKKVSFISTTSKHINEELRASMGAAVIDNNGNPLVFIDAEKFPLMSKQQQVFLIEHECAHHELGHTKFSRQQFYNSPSGIEKIENDADCQAMKKLKDKYRFSNLDFSLLYRDYYDPKVLRKIGIFGGVPDTTDEELFNYGYKRVSSMQQCMAG